MLRSNLHESLRCISDDAVNIASWSFFQMVGPEKPDIFLSPVGDEERIAFLDTFSGKYIQIFLTHKKMLFPCFVFSWKKCSPSKQVKPSRLDGDLPKEGFAEVKHQSK